MKFKRNLGTVKVQEMAYPCFIEVFTPDSFFDFLKFQIYFLSPLSEVRRVMNTSLVHFARLDSAV